MPLAGLQWAVQFAVNAEGDAASAGRTMRWGLAWSFAVDRGKASQPLVRQPRPQRLAVPRPK